jgi:hypothetical protein
MKTNQIMIRQNKGFIQRTKDGYFNATALLDDWNTRGGNKPVQMNNYKSSGATARFMNQLKSEGIDEPVVTARGKNGGTWMHPKLFIDFAMYVSVEFKSTVIDYVLDGLIKSRHDAGNYYNEMCATILQTHVEFYGTKPNPSLYIDEAKRIKKLLNVNKERNLMSEIELSNITLMQKQNAIMLRKKVGKDARIKQLRILAELLTSD